MSKENRDFLFFILSYIGASFIGAGIIILIVVLITRVL